ncbi:MAG: hypothetical protein HQL88_01570, partial [Magnetococcales bacterium]|nr:hypothetical protein [Magnetococcales bacterium]
MAWGRMPRTLWPRIWRRTSLTAKAVGVALLLGGVFWVSTDLWQSAQVEAIVHQKLLNDLEIQAQRDRTLFDEYVRQQEQTVRLLSYHAPLIHHVERQKEAWAADPG